MATGSDVVASSGIQTGALVRFKKGSALWNNYRHAEGRIARIFAPPNNGIRVDVDWNSDQPPAFGLDLSLLEIADRSNPA